MKYIRPCNLEQHKSGYVSDVSGLLLIQPHGAPFYCSCCFNMHRCKIQLCPLVERKPAIYFHRESDAA